MDLLQFINCAAHTVAFLGVCTYIILLFGRHDSRVYKWPLVSCLILRVFLAIIAVGHLSCVFVEQPVPWPEVLLNAGLAVMWPWVSWFHYGMFISKKLD